MKLQHLAKKSDTDNTKQYEEQGNRGNSLKNHQIWAVQNFTYYNSLAIFLAHFRKNLARSHLPLLSLTTARSHFCFGDY